MRKFLSKLIKFIKARFAPRGSRLSFAGSGEDLIIHDYFLKRGIKKPTYIDIGAYHPIYGSNTYLLYLVGGRGILVEPNKEICKKIIKKRPLDRCINAGIGRTDGEAEFYLFGRETRSTFSKEEKAAWEKQSGEVAKVEKIPLVSLSSLIKKYCGGKAPDFISIDTEGYEMEILSSFNWEYKPKVLCVEIVSSSGEENIEVQDLIYSQGYRLIGKTMVNSIYALI